MLTDRIDAALLQQASGLKVVSQMAVGVDNIDLIAATQRGIPVGHTPGVLTETTADCAFALLMAAARRLGEAQTYIRTGRWQTWHPLHLTGQDIHGAVLGIIGFGRIGQAVARRAAGFNMRVVYYHPASIPGTHHLTGAEAVTLEELLATADFVSLHLPLTPETHHFINTQTLAQMKPSSILINTARGGVVDSEALYQALAHGQIAYAALDVTEPEPIPLNHPLLSLDNCLIVPHIGSATIATRTRMAQMAVENLLAGLAGQILPHCANPEVYPAK
jgi:lactate dehydrogenase-like 2-hydroxyacid dehydrogenase